MLNNIFFMLGFVLCFVFYFVYFVTLYCFYIFMYIVSPFVPPFSYFCTSLPTTAIGWKPNCFKYHNTTASIKKKSIFVFQSQLTNIRLS
jgi:hypothetical protein